MDLLLGTPEMDVFDQMAFDESAVRVHDGGVWLRFYRWTPGPAVTFGYAQSWSLVQREISHPSCAAVRRPTGGGMVFHGDDLTFSCVFCSVQRPAEIYKMLHSTWSRELTALLPVVLEGKTSAAAYAPALGGKAGACFINPVENDLLAQNGQKILGGAIRRFDKTVLYQGSLQFPGARENPLFKRALIAGTERVFGAVLSARRAPETILQAGRELAQNCYRTDEWNKKF